MPSREDVQFGKKALYFKLITDVQLEECLKEQSEKPQSLIALLIKKGYLKISQVETVLKASTTENTRESPISPSETSPISPSEPPTMSPFELLPITSSEKQNVSEIRIGKTFGKYRILEEVGRGGMGAVYKAYEPQLQRNVALKILLSGETAKPGDLERFMREAKATAKLKHPNIVAVYDIGNEGGQFYFTMEFIEGISLKSFARAHHPLSQVVQIMKKVAEAVHYAHTQGIIHRDLKPANIMVDSNNEVKVMDFGLAKMSMESRKLSKSGMILGTLQYMPPEQAEGRHNAIDATSDVYALGAMLYELLTGVPPFTGGTSFEILSQIATKDPVLPSKINPRIPKDLESISLKALEKEKKRRYKSAESFAQDLDRFSKGEQVEARSIGTIGRMVRKIKKKKWVAGIVSVFGAVVFILTMVINNLQMSSNQKISNACIVSHDWKSLKVGLDILKHDSGKYRAVLDYAVSHVQSELQKMFSENKWKDIHQFLSDMEDGWLNQPGVSEEVKKPFQDMTRQLEAYEFFEGGFTLSAAADDERSRNAFYLWDTMAQRICLVEMNQKIMLPPRLYLLISMSRGKKLDDIFYLNIQPGKELKLNLYTCPAKNEDELINALQSAKPGCQIRLLPVLYNINMLLGPSHSHIRLQGSSDGNSRTMIHSRDMSPIFLFNVSDFKISKIAFFDSPPLCIQACEYISLDSLNISTKNVMGIKVERSKSVNINKIEFQNPLDGIYCANSTGIAITSNSISIVRRTAIEIVGCQNVYIWGNKDQTESGEYGIKISDTNMAEAIFNECSLKTKFGIFWDHGSYCSLSMNTCYKNKLGGIALSGIENFIVYGNRLENNSIGLCFNHLSHKTEKYNLLVNEPFSFLCQNYIYSNIIGMKLEDINDLKIQENILEKNRLAIELCQFSQNRATKNFVCDSNIFWQNDKVGKNYDILSVDIKGFCNTLKRWQNESDLDQSSKKEGNHDGFNGLKPSLWPAEAIWQEDSFYQLPSFAYMALTGFQERGWRNVDTIRLIPQDDSNEKSTIRYENGIVYLPLKRSIGTKRNTTGKVKNSQIILEDKNDKPGVFAAFALPLHSYDTIVRVKLDMEDNSSGKDKDQKVIFTYNLAEPGHILNGGKVTSVGSWREHCMFNRAWRPAFVQLEWPEKEGNMQRVEKMVLKGIEMKVEYEDIGQNLWEQSDCQWIETYINGKPSRYRTKVKSGQNMKLKFVVRNVGKSPWIPRTGFPVAIRCINGEKADSPNDPLAKGIILEQKTYPYQIATFEKEFVPPWLSGHITLQWQMHREHPSSKHDLWIGQPIVISFDIEN